MRFQLSEVVYPDTEMYRDGRNFLFLNKNQNIIFKRVGAYPCGRPTPRLQFFIFKNKKFKSWRQMYHGRPQLRIVS